MSIQDLLKKSLEAQRSLPADAPAARLMTEDGADSPKDYKALREQREREATGRTRVRPVIEQKAIQPKQYEFPEGIDFISEITWNAHLGLYDNYVTKYNEVCSLLKTAPKAKSNSAFSVYSELRRRYSFLWNAIALHDLYFTNLGKEGPDPPQELIEKMNGAFGSVEVWREDFAACAMGTSGWAILALDNDGDLVNFTMDDHQTGMLTDVKPILVLDVYEHAYWADHIGQKDRYIKGFLDNILWSEVVSRLNNKGGS